METVQSFVASSLISNKGCSRPSSKDPKSQADSCQRSCCFRQGCAHRADLKSDFLAQSNVFFLWQNSIPNPFAQKSVTQMTERAKLKASTKLERIITGEK